MARFNHTDPLRETYKPQSTGQFQILNEAAVIIAAKAARGTPGTARH